MLKILVIRHGETSWNKEKIFRGRADISLSEIGLQQARLLGQRLKRESIRNIYTSPLKRAVETALAVQAGQAIQSGSATIIHEDQLIDIDYGAWEKKRHLQVKEEFPYLYQQWLDAPHTVHIPDGEDLSSIRRRVETFLTRLVAQQGQYEQRDQQTQQRQQDQQRQEENYTIALVSHRVIIKVLLCAALGLDNSHFWQIKQDTAALSVLDYQAGRFVLTSLNDICHLEELQDKMSRDDF